MLVSFGVMLLYNQRQSYFNRGGRVGFEFETHNAKISSMKFIQIVTTMLILCMDLERTRSMLLDIYSTTETQ
jgi:hypothetical protein